MVRMCLRIRLIRLSLCLYRTAEFRRDRLPQVHNLRGKSSIPARHLLDCRRIQLSTNCCIRQRRQLGISYWLRTPFRQGLLQPFVSQRLGMIRHKPLWS